MSFGPSNKLLAVVIPPLWCSKKLWGKVENSRTHTSRNSWCTIEVLTIHSIVKLLVIVSCKKINKEMSDLQLGIGNHHSTWHDILQEIPWGGWPFPPVTYAQHWAQSVGMKPSSIMVLKVASMLLIHNIYILANFPPSWHIFLITLLLMASSLQNPLGMLFITLECALDPALPCITLLVRVATWCSKDYMRLVFSFICIWLWWWS